MCHPVWWCVFVWFCSFDGLRSVVYCKGAQLSSLVMMVLRVVLLCTGIEHCPIGITMWHRLMVQCAMCKVLSIGLLLWVVTKMTSKNIEPTHNSLVHSPSTWFGLVFCHFAIFFPNLFLSALHVFITVWLLHFFLLHQKIDLHKCGDAFSLSDSYSELQIITYNY